TGAARVLPGRGAIAVFITAGNGDVVSLRGLVIDGQGVGSVGIEVLGASAAHIQRCVIRNFESVGSGFGILFEPGNGGVSLFVSDTIIFNNGSNATTPGIRIAPGGAGGNIGLDRGHLGNNVIGLGGYGIFSVNAGPHVVLRDSVVSGNAADGILATSDAGHVAFVAVERTSAVNNGGAGIHADGIGAVMLLTDDTVARNATGIGAVNGGQIISYG